jgi:hypothetical protein
VDEINQYYRSIQRKVKLHDQSFGLILQKAMPNAKKQADPVAESACELGYLVVI